LIEREWAEDGTYADPAAHIACRTALVDHIRGFFEQLPKALTFGLMAERRRQWRDK
jgi:hypothetical protein